MAAIADRADAADANLGASAAQALERLGGNSKGADSAAHTSTRRTSEVITTMTSKVIACMTPRSKATALDKYQSTQIRINETAHASARHRASILLLALLGLLGTIAFVAHVSTRTPLAPPTT